MPKLEGQPFINSDTCDGVAYLADDAPLDFSEVHIHGRYPVAGFARNNESHEIVHVLHGVGRLMFAVGEEMSLETGQVVHVPARQWFAWEGDMKLGMSCSLPFNTEQYDVFEIDVGDEVFMRVHQTLDKYFPEDKLFVEMEGMNLDDIVGFLYGQLIEAGEDPDEIFRDFGITEEES